MNNNKFSLELKAEGDGTIIKNCTLIEILEEMKHQLKKKLWEKDDIMQIKLNGEIIEDIDYKTVKELFK